VLLKIFSEHLLTIISKLVDGMSATYLKYLFNNKHETEPKLTTLEEFEKLANQWSMHHISPKNLNMSITSIQSAISKEVMWEEFEGECTKELKIPSGLKRHYQRYLESSPDRNTQNEDECPKTEKMYERIEFMREAGKLKLQNLVFPNENSNPNASTSRWSKENSSRRISKKFPMWTLQRVWSKENTILTNNKSESEEDSIKNTIHANRWISTRALNQLTMNYHKDEESMNPYSLLKSTSRNIETTTPILSLKSTTINTPSGLEQPFMQMYSPHFINRLNAATPMLEGPKLNNDVSNK